jgi:hypothetical protein
LIYDRKNSKMSAASPKILVLWAGNAISRPDCRSDHASESCGLRIAIEYPIPILNQTQQRKRQQNSKMKRSFINRLFALAFGVSASVAMAAFTPITNVTYTTISGPPDQLILTGIVADGNTVLASTLGVGTSIGSPSSGNTHRMDDFDLNNIAYGHAAPLNTVLFGGVPFTNVNGSLPDFFLFEASGYHPNPDDITVAAIFLDGSVGQAVACPVAVSTPSGTIPGWGNTGLVIVPGSAVAYICGLCWDITDLMDADGTNLLSTAIIKGIQIAGPGGSSIDPCVFLATAPAPPAANITYNQSSGTLQLNWPPGHVWRLQSQTNSLTVGISNNWGDVYGPLSPPYNAPVNPANATVFYRLVWP